MTRQIEIHEFSTGIVIETKADGSWFSRGFTGRYMNCTLDPIPYPIQEAISNRLFAIAEGASSDTPAMIGREVGTQGEIWSVVAVVTKARDESRSFSAYRYFCVEGKGNLHKILRFLKENPLQFNPLDEKTIGNPHLFIDNHETKIPLENFQDLLSESIPVIVPFHRNCNHTMINAITEEMAGENMTAWAYNVQALDKPASFYVIKPHDEKAEAIIRKSLSNQVITNRPIFDEQKIKTAVTSLCKRNKIKVEYIKTLEEALSNPDINDTFWQSIFDGQGLKQAKSQGIYNDEMTRLFTLQGLILPRTLPEFLKWLKDIKRDDLLTISNNFQYDILKILTHEFRSEYIVKKIELGVILIILLKNNSLIKQVINLLKTEKSLWGYYYINQVSHQIDEDLKLMKNYSQYESLYNSFYIFNYDSWKEIRDELTIAWRVPPNSNRFKPIAKYQVWVRLFDGLNESKFALFFAHIAYDTIPKNIFTKVQSVKFTKNFYYVTYFVKMRRDVSIYELFIFNLKNLLTTDIDIKLGKLIILITMLSLGSFAYLFRAYLFSFAYNNFGIFYYYLGEYHKAIDDYTKAIQLNPNYTDAYYSRGIAYYNLKQYKKAIFDYTHVILLDSNYISAYMNRGNAYNNSGQYEKAITDYTQAIQLNPNDVSIYINRGNAYTNLEEYEKAIADYTYAIQLNPNSTYAYFNRAIAYRMLGKDEKAIADENKADELIDLNE